MIVPKVRQPVFPTPVTHEKLLLIEGDTPSHFFEAFARHLDISEQIEIRNYGGITELGKYLKTLASTADFRTTVRSLGIARDAEDNPEGARRSIEHAISDASLAARVSVKVGVLPDDGPGMIETLCVRSIERDSSYECIDTYIGSLEARGLKLPDGIGIAKHMAQAYLIAMNYPQLMPGLAAYKDVWPFESPVFSRVREFLTSL